MIMEFFLFWVEFYKKQQQENPVGKVSLNNKNLFLNFPKYIEFLRALLILVSFLIFILSWFANAKLISLVLGFSFIFLLLKQFEWFNFLKQSIRYLYRFDYLLLNFLVDNELLKDNYNLESAELSYEITDKELIIYAYKAGGLSSKLENLDLELSALFNLPLEEKIIRPAIVEYKFILERPERLVLKSSSKESIDDLEIDLGYGVKYDPVTCPHILVAGGTGSGKSVFISFLILELLKRNSTIYIADPKNSDLGSLAYYLGNERVATNPNNIARIIRLAVTEMHERYSEMRENFKYGTNFNDHGYKPIWLIFDEMGAFLASGTDKNSKAVVNEVMDGIKQIILLGRQAGVFVLISAQQMSANTLNTDLRDNLGLRVALGANSQEGYKMVFGSTSPTPQPIEEKGAGFLYLQGSGKETAQYWESPFLDTHQFDFINELNLYIDKE